MISAALPDLDALDIEALKALVIAQHSELLEQRKSNAQEIEHLKLVIEKYRRMIFGRKSEKLRGQLEQLEFRLEELETAQAADVAAQATIGDAQQDSPQTTTKPRSRPARPIERGLPGPGLLSHVLVSKFGDHSPLYRQSEIYAREGVDLDRSTLAG